ncbi:MAG: DUF6463 family protein [Gemmatimonadota bacterium]
MSRWAGRSILAVGVIHCLVGAMVFSRPLKEILGDGFWDAVDGHAGRPLAFWFEFAGLLTILFGIAIDWIEKEGKGFPVALRYGFLLLVVVAIVAMPFSGGWLLVPGAMGLLMKRNRVLESDFDR